MRRISARVVPALLLCALLGLAACGGGGSSSPGGSSPGGGGGGTTIGMNPTNFTEHSAMVTAGQPVTFDDTVNGGGVHVLCVGTGTGGSQSCDAASAAPNAPTELTGSGMTFNAGDKKQVTFSKPGTYHVICTIHAGMYIDITVQ